MTATLFRLHRLEDGRHAAWALLCPDARYCSLIVPGSGALVRRFADVKAWKDIELDLGLGLEPGPLPADLHIVRLIAGEQAKALITQYVTAFEPQAEPLALTDALDAKLREQVTVNA